MSHVSRSGSRGYREYGCKPDRIPALVKMIEESADEIHTFKRRWAPADSGCRKRHFYFRRTPIPKRSTYG